MLLPVRLRYNMMTNRYSLVAQTDDGVFIRKHLHNLVGLRQGRPLTKKQWATAQQAYADYCQSHRAYFHLQLTDVRASLPSIRNPIVHTTAAISS